MPKTELTAELTAEITDGVKAGEWPSRAAARHGVVSTQWRTWIDLGDRLEESSATSEPQTDLADHERLCVDLVRRVDQAEAECECQWLSNVRTAGAAGRGKDWTAWMTLLERRFPARWCKRPQESIPAEESLEQMLARLQLD